MTENQPKTQYFGFWTHANGKIICTELFGTEEQVAEFGMLGVNFIRKIAVDEQGNVRIIESNEE